MLNARLTIGYLWEYFLCKVLHIHQYIDTFAGTFCMRCGKIKRK